MKQTCATCAIYDRMGMCYLPFAKKKVRYKYERRKTAEGGVQDWLIDQTPKPVHHLDTFTCPKWRDVAGRNKEQALEAERAGRR